MSAAEDVTRIVQQAMSYQVGLFEALLHRFGNCEREMAALAKAPEFEGKRTIMIMFEGARYMHARLYAIAPILAEIGQEGLKRDEVGAGIVQLIAVWLDDALATCVAADLVGEHAARHIVTLWRDQIAMRDKDASMRLEVPRTLAAIATLNARETDTP